MHNVWCKFLMNSMPNAWHLYTSLDRLIGITINTADGKFSQLPEMIVSFKSEVPLQCINIENYKVKLVDNALIIHAEI